MPIAPDDIRGFGQEIADLYETEVAQRTVVGRLYYSIYVEVRDKLGVRERRRAHDAVKSALQKKTRKVTGSQFADLRELREMADYELEHSGWSEKLHRASRLSDQILREFRKRVH